MLQSPVGFSELAYIQTENVNEVRVKLRNGLVTFTDCDEALLSDRQLPTPLYPGELNVGALLPIPL